MNKIKTYKLNDKMNKNIKMINEKKINELKEKEIKQDELIKKYEDYINKTILIFKNILNQLNTIHNLLNLENSNKLNNLINNYSLTLQNLNVDDISHVINQKLEQFINHLKNGNNNNDKNTNEIIKIIKNNSNITKK